MHAARPSVMSTIVVTVTYFRALFAFLAASDQGSGFQSPALLPTRGNPIDSERANVLLRPEA